MSTKLEETPDYQNAHAQYVASVAVAERTQDETGKLRAELEWERTSHKLQSEFATSVTLAQRLKEVHEQIEKEYPMVPKSVIEHISDPEALLKAAQEIQAKFGAGDWGTPAGQSGGTGTSRGSALKEENDLRDRVNKGDTQALKQFKKNIVARQVMPFIQRQSQEGNR